MQLGWTAAAMLPMQARGTSRKHVTIPFPQPVAPDRNLISVVRLIITKLAIQMGLLHWIPSKIQPQTHFVDSRDQRRQRDQRCVPWTRLLVHERVQEVTGAPELSSVSALNSLLHRPAIGSANSYDEQYRDSLGQLSICRHPRQNKKK